MPNNFDLGTELYGAPPAKFDLGTELYGQATPSWGDNLNTSLNDIIMNKLAPAAANYSQGKEGAGMLTGDIAGSVGQAIMAIPGSGVQTLYQSAPEAIQKPIAAVGDYIANSAPVKYAGEVAAAHPDAAQILGNIASVQGGGAVLSGALNAGANLAADSTGMGHAMPGVPPKYSPADYQAAINNTYEKSLQARKSFYDFMDNAAAGQTVNVTPIVNDAKNAIAEIEANQFHEARSTLPRLRSFVANYGESPQMPLADAVAMKQDINSVFNPSKFTQNSKSPIFNIGSYLGDAIDKASANNPLFAKAKALADTNHVENMANAFQNNDLLAKSWTPKDYNAQKTIDRGLSSYLPDETMLRQRQIISNIKTPEQLNAVTRVLPPDMAQEFRNQLAKQLTAGSGAYRVGELGNAVGDITRSPKHIWNAIVGEKLSPDKAALLAATKAASPQLTTEKLAQQLMLLKGFGD